MTTPQKRIADTITARLEDQERKVHWLATKTGLSNSTLTRRLKLGHGFTVEEIGLIAPAIGMTELELMAAGYANQTNKAMAA